jgi:hypothetical protein
LGIDNAAENPIPKNKAIQSNPIQSSLQVAQINKLIQYRMEDTGSNRAGFGFNWFMATCSVSAVGAFLSERRKRGRISCCDAGTT